MLSSAIEKLFLWLEKNDSVEDSKRLNSSFLGRWLVLIAAWMDVVSTSSMKESDLSIIEESFELVVTLNPSRNLNCGGAFTTLERSLIAWVFRAAVLFSAVTSP